MARNPVFDKMVTNRTNVSPASEAPVEETPIVESPAPVAPKAAPKPTATAPAKRRGRPERTDVPPISEGTPCYLRFRVTGEEQAQIKSYCYANRISIDEYLRSCVLADFNKRRK